MTATKTPIEAGQYRADPGKKGRIVHVLSKATGKYYADNDWLVKTVGAGGRTSTVSGFRLVCWPIVDAPTDADPKPTTDPKDTP
jgi:hypothetical protein